MMAALTARRVAMVAAACLNAPAAVEAYREATASKPLRANLFEQAGA